MFRSVRNTCKDRCVGVLLTGMGKDGVDELKKMKDAGIITIVQDKDSSVINGMPAEAINIGAACEILPPDEIGKRLISLVNSDK